MTIDDILARVLAQEGGYTNSPGDKGGETNFGVTAAVARANGYTGSMRAMTRDQALAIYRGQYVIVPGFGIVSNVSMVVAAELIDTGVNMGTGTAARFLQRALNALTGAGLTLDGKIGPNGATIGALKAYVTLRGAEGERRLVTLLNALQGTRYVEIVEGDATQRQWIYGWLARLL